jgi:hypothetical protein
VKALKTTVKVPTDDNHVVVQVDDPSYSRLRATFTYLGFVVARRGLQLALIGMEVAPAPDVPLDKTLVLSMTDMRRDLPLPRWQKAARTAAIRESRESMAWLSRGIARTGEDMQAVAGLLPDLATRPFASILEDHRARRQLDSALLLARIAREYRENIASGVSDPVATIARERGWTASKARTLVYRARKQGFLGPAIGRTAGEKGVS